MSFCVYIIKNSKNDKIYIGATTKTLDQRLLGHFNGMYFLSDAIRELGRECFSIHEIRLYSSIEEMYSMEAFI